MTIYIVLVGFNYDATLHGAYSTKEKAEAEVDRLDKEYTYADHCYNGCDIEECVLNE